MKHVALLKLTLIPLLFLMNFDDTLAQPKPAYQIYTSAGEQTDFGAMKDAALEADIVFFGELHNNPVIHWLQLELFKSMQADTTKSMMLGMEMFEADNQVIIDEYFSGMITQNNFEREVRLWNNYQTDYKPVVEFAREHSIPLIATNIPRRYASMVYSGGLESLENLSKQALKWIAPLPVEVDLSLPGYKNIMEAAHGHGGENLPKSQAIKDATMAHFILENAEFEARFLHLNGTYHTDNREGIMWYLNQSRPLLKLMNISVAESENPSEFPGSEEGKGDFIIVVSKTMTKTY